jgi:hypothetical protein
MANPCLGTAWVEGHSPLPPLAAAPLAAVRLLPSHLLSTSITAPADATRGTAYPQSGPPSGYPRRFGQSIAFSKASGLVGWWAGGAMGWWGDELKLTVLAVILPVSHYSQGGSHGESRHVRLILCVPQSNREVIGLCLQTRNSALLSLGKIRLVVNCLSLEAVVIHLGDRKTTTGCIMKRWSMGMCRGRHNGHRYRMCHGCHSGLHLWRCHWHRW